jgi:flagellar protein FliS
MISNPYSEQLEQQVLCADRIELVGIMFDHLVACVMEARQSLLSGDRMARGRSIAKALGLVGELSRSLDVEKGGEFARNLQPIYAFVARRLVEAQTQQLEKPLIEAAETLRPLRDAWKELDRSRAEVCPPLDNGAIPGMNPEPNMRFALRA